MELGQGVELGNEAVKCGNHNILIFLIIIGYKILSLQKKKSET